MVVCSHHFSHSLYFVRGSIQFLRLQELAFLSRFVRTPLTRFRNSNLHTVQPVKNVAVFTAAPSLFFFFFCGSNNKLFNAC